MSAKKNHEKTHPQFIYEVMDGKVSRIKETDTEPAQSPLIDIAKAALQLAKGMKDDLDQLEKEK